MNMRHADPNADHEASHAVVRVSICVRMDKVATLCHAGADVSGLDSSASAPARRLSLRGPEATPRQDGVSRRLTDLLAAAVPGHLSLATVARVLARMRAGGELLRPEEWRCYSVALGEGGTAARFAAAAAVVGCTVRLRSASKGLIMSPTHVS